ncbi:MAG: class I poly(R)-hydroxyalkanoic acid synthase [Betaproteobacteria bacterium]|nr:class I poly(R)-hydroxyalkanoic acid synthase [Betaproteobacteria bacterium]MDE2622314.1 class I poly(R)-hydroxyalkanoic acid synthase [Betaproteobacteria bacterium]
MMEEAGARLAGFRPEDYQNFLRELAQAVARDAPRWQELQARYYQDQAALWMNMLSRAAGQTPPVHGAEAGTQTLADRRFSAPEWSETPLFDYLQQSYLLTAQWLKEAVGSLELEPKTRKRLDFFLRQYIDAMAPSNFPATNPEVLKKAFESGGESLRAGLKNFLADMEKGRISMTDETAFEVGRNIAVTPGSVVFENELFQLLQYAPATAEVASRPLLMVPPCINKYYILDLEPSNSMVRYALEQGHTVFLMSWRNIDESLQQTTWDDYIERGVATAIRTVQAISDVPQIDALGFCVGGALLACTLAAHAAEEPLPVASLTLMTTLLDYSDVGEIGVYIDPGFVAQRELLFSKGGVVPGKELAMAFSSLRANDLIWPYVVNNYLKGETPPAFDLLYWNSDGTNLPGPMFAWYLRHLYLQNELSCPNALTVAGRPVDLGRITVPTYVFAAREDHIVPWKSAFETTHLLSGPMEFVLGASGHIAGSINPASKNKRNYWVGGPISGSADEWLASATPVSGSWWRHWANWLHNLNPERVPAPAQLGNAEHPPIESAPGRYVKARC